VQGQTAGFQHDPEGDSGQQNAGHEYELISAIQDAASTVV
jgi:hypothetical protein